MLFRSYRRQKTWLCNCLKRYVSAQPRTVNMLNGPKKCCNLHDSSLITLLHHSERTSVRKCLS